MNKKLLTLLTVCGISIATFAGVPVRRTVTHQQPDGTSLTVTISANGRYTTYTTTDGTPLLRAKDGHFYYAAVADNNIVSTQVLAHNASLRNADEKAKVASFNTSLAAVTDLLETENPAERLTPAEVPSSSVKAFYASTTDGVGKYGTSANGVVKSIGSPVIPVVMVNFSDKTFQDTITVEKVTRFFNEEGYKDEQYAIGSVRDYFVAQSGGMFSPTFEVVATVTLPQTYKYYGADSEKGATDPNIKTFVKDALDAVPETVDFSKYVVGSNVPNVILMFAGPGEQSAFEDGYTDYIWAKFSTSGSFTVNDGKVKIGSYLVANELLNSYGTGPNDIRSTHLDGVGLVCHEFSHALGLPDLYYTGSNSTTYATLHTMGYWSIMDYGQYYYNGYRPTGYTAHERSLMGWLDIKELTEKGTYNLYAAGQESLGATAYLIRNDENAKEYFILENRQPSTWYGSLMGKGMLVMHIDYDSQRWNYNTLNNDASKQRVAVVHADNVNEWNGSDWTGSTSDFWAGIKSDLFPGGQNVTSLTDDTTPSTATYEGTTKKLGKPIYNIALTEEGVITFSFLDETITGINQATLEDDTQNAYTLQGVRVASLKDAAPGIYILQNGKKIVKK